MSDKIDISSKEDCVRLVAYTVTSMQKWKSIYMENEGESGIYNSLIVEDGKYDKYLEAFIKMQNLGDKIEPLHIVNLLYYVNYLYPAVGIIMTANGLDFPNTTSAREILSIIKWR